MKIAVTSQNRRTITEHAGRCRKFWIFDIDKEQITGCSLLELPKEQCFHECPGNESHALDVVNVLISGGMGQGLVNRLARRGISSVITNEEDPKRAVLKYLEGSLQHQEVGTCQHEGCHSTH